MVFFGAICGMVYASGTRCKQNEMIDCILLYPRFEEIFPLYGADENELNKTCADIHTAIVCPTKFEACDAEESCNERCMRLVFLLESVHKYFNLGYLFEKLCQGTTSFRTRYLQHISCLRNTSVFFEECRNTTQDSLQHLSNNKELISNETQCCLLTWAQGCYVKKASETCGNNAGRLVSDGFEILKPPLQEHCWSHKRCALPPLPGNVTGVYHKPTEPAATMYAFHLRHEGNSAASSFVPFYHYLAFVLLSYTYHVFI